GRGGLAACGRRRAGAAAEQKCEPSAETPHRVDQAAERNPCGISVVFFGFSLVLFWFFVFCRVVIVGGAAPDEAGSAGEGQERGQSENDREHKSVKSQHRRAKHHT